MPEKDNCMEHGERLATLEARTDALHGRFDDLTLSVSGLATKVQDLTTTLEKYKWFLLAIILLLGMDNKTVKAVTDKIIGVIF